MSSSGPDSLVEAAISGDRRALARLISLIEDHAELARPAMAALYPQGGNARVVGVTGVPGGGKSTLVDQLISLLRTQEESVGVVAVDPSSPFTGGAILGDRIRMQDHALDDGVFIRSMSNRGHLGGLSAASSGAALALDAAGFEHVFIETVGVGQSEVEIVDSADTTVVVLTAGWGDSVQANKAGLLEIGDVFVVNKADLPGADATVGDIQQMLAMALDREWTPPVVRSVASNGEGIDEVWGAIAGHTAHLRQSGRLEDLRRRRAENDLRRALSTEAERRSQEQETPGFAEAAAAVAQRRVDPWTAAADLLDSA